MVFHQEDFLHLFQNIKEDGDQFRIKMYTGTLGQFSPCLLIGKGLSVGTVGGHAVIGIRNGNDSGPYGNLFPRQPIRVAGSIIMFVMMLNEGKDVGGKF